MLGNTLDSIILREGKDLNFSCAVIAVQDGEIILTRSVGYSNSEKGIKNDTSTKMNIASVGKLYTKIIILQLIVGIPAKRTEMRLKNSGRILGYFEETPEAGVQKLLFIS